MQIIYVGGAGQLPRHGGGGGGGGVRAGRHGALPRPGDRGARHQGDEGLYLAIFCLPLQYVVWNCSYLFCSSHSAD